MCVNVHICVYVCINVSGYVCVSIHVKVRYWMSSIVLSLIFETGSTESAAH